MYIFWLKLFFFIWPKGMLFWPPQKIRKTASNSLTQLYATAIISFCYYATENYI